MTCPACTEAEANVATHSFQSGCQECAARAVAHSQVYFDSARAGVMTTEYRGALQKTFGADWAVWHPKVKTWAERIKA